jgi:hypothetical protein
MAWGEVWSLWCSCLCALEVASCGALHCRWAFVRVCVCDCAGSSVPEAGQPVVAACHTGGRLAWGRAHSPPGWIGRSFTCTSTCPAGSAQSSCIAEGTEVH